MNFEPMPPATEPALIKDVEATFGLLTQAVVGTLRLAEAVSMVGPSMGAGKEGGIKPSLEGAPTMGGGPERGI